MTNQNALPLYPKKCIYDMYVYLTPRDHSTSYVWYYKKVICHEFISEGTISILYKIGKMWKLTP